MRDNSVASLRLSCPIPALNAEDIAELYWSLHDEPNNAEAMIRHAIGRN